MGHLGATNYNRLWKRMDQFPQGVFNSRSLYEILKILFTDEEAKLCSLMPLHYFSAQEMAKIWGEKEEEAESILKTLADKGLVYVHKEENTLKYFLAPPVIGFFEFSMMRLDNRFDKKRLAELFHKYIDLEDGFVKKYALFYPYLTRAFVNEDAIRELKTEVLPFEKISTMINNARSIAVGTCFCRHKMEHLGMACDNPQEVCLTFDGIAQHLVEHGIARNISKGEAHRIVKMCIERGLVQIGDNIKDHLVMVCNCCSCCCDILRAYKKCGPNAIINPTNFIAGINNATCNMCCKCAKMCPVNAISIVKGKVKVDRKICIGCGVCARFCPTKSCRLKSRPKKTYIPENTIERVALLAFDQGKAGNFLFDDQKSAVHLVMRNLINLITKFPPIKILLMNRRVNMFILNIVSKYKKYIEA